MAAVPGVNRKAAEKLKEGLSGEDALKVAQASLPAP
jgi:hypothetical protein